MKRERKEKGFILPSEGLQWVFRLWELGLREGGMLKYQRVTKLGANGPEMFVF